MYRYFFNGCLGSLGIGTLLGLAAVWMPEAWHNVGWRLLCSDIIIFASASIGAVLCKLGEA